MKFTLITVSFNSCTTIEKTIKSVLSQNFNDYEYIIVDGDSKDKTVEIINSYEPLFKGKMHWISEPDNGIYDAMNKGLKMAKGDIIGIVNSDDWLEHNTLALLNEYINSHKLSDNFLISGVLRFHNVDGSTKLYKPNLPRFYHFIKIYELGGIAHPSTFVSKSVYNSVGLFDKSLSLSADADFILRCAFSNCQFNVLPEVLSNMSAGGISTSFNWKSFKRAYSDRKKILQKYDLSPIMYTYLLSRWLSKSILKRILKFLKILK